MKTKIIGILVCMLLIATALPAAGTLNDNKTIRGTIQQPVPDLTCDGNLIWVGVLPGDTVTGSFIVENIGDAQSELNWEIDLSTPGFGNPQFDHTSGTGLKPEDGPFTVEVVFTAPGDLCTRFDGDIRINNTDDPNNDYCLVPVSLTTPVSQQVNTHLLSQMILERFPNAFPILRHLMGI